MKKLAILLAAAFHASAFAGILTDGFDSVMRSDPGYMSALSERDANQTKATAAKTAYLPEFNASRTTLPTESRPRTTYSVMQPIIDGARMATFMQAGPRQEFADTTFLVREQDVAGRFFKAVADYLRAEEGLQLNIAKKKAYAQQMTAAKRALSSGLGTVADLKDAEVRYEQARASDFAFIAERNAAQRQIENMTGLPAWAGNKPPVLAEVVGEVRIPESMDVADGVSASNPQVEIARLEKRLADLDVRKAQGSLLPTIGFTYTNTEINGERNDYSGIAIQMPLASGGIMSVATASATARQKHYLAEETATRLQMEAARFRDLVLAGVAELDGRRAAVAAAEIGAESNEKSFKGGVKSRTDVLNSIQMLYQARMDYVNAQINLAENLLKLNLQIGKGAKESLRQAEKALFRTS